MYLLAGIISARNNWNRRGAVRAAWADASQVPELWTFEKADTLLSVGPVPCQRARIGVLLRLQMSALHPRTDAAAAGGVRCREPRATAGRSCRCPTHIFVP